MQKPWAAFAVLILIPSLTAAAFQSWEQVHPPVGLKNVSAVLAHPTLQGQLIAAAGNHIYEETVSGAWKKLWGANERQMEIHRLVRSEEIPHSIFALTQTGLWQGNTNEKKLKKVFSGKNDKERHILSFLILPGDNEHWFVGTERGLFETDDAGRTWFPFIRFAKDTVPVLYFAKGRMFAATPHRLYASKDLDYFEPVFSLTSGAAEEFLELEEAIEEAVDFDEGAFTRSDFFDLMGSRGLQGRLWLGTRKGIFESSDGGQSWHMLSRSGLKSLEVQRIVYSEASQQIFAGTPEGIYVYRDRFSRWEELYKGLIQNQALDLILLEKGGGEKLVSVTRSGLAKIPIEIAPGPKPEISLLPDKMVLFQELIRLEPAAREVHGAVIRYGNFKNSKIKRWQAQSRLAALLPDFSFGRDRSDDNNVDIDRRSTSDPDQFILGPDDISKGWDMDVSWDLGEFIYSSDQTSIDSREKLMVDIRNDFLAEATRIYYERRRLQTETALTGAASELEHFERLTRLDELTALLDAMTEGFMTKRLEALYRGRPELSSLWQYVAPLSKPRESSDNSI